ncbi:SRR1 family protein [Aspergillus melleus]|uniref:SRR1 family protein n=1 Tax=Aspergillus melleus TaxID=138277 RepID=UPI001E8CBA96|nr:uncharacterized protein LDX57_006708 [Aspergillus melleus]KAH8429037.1 hypothetical protein LDX57_006708 [Aspergillus melleus]
MSDKLPNLVPDDEELDLDTVNQVKDRLAHIQLLYDTGKPFFPRALLEDLSRQIDQGAEEVVINDVDDMPQKYSLKVPAWCADFASTYRINYATTQHLTHLTLICPEQALRTDHTPVSIVYVRSLHSPSNNTVEQVRERFNEARDLWLASATYRDLDRIISTLSLTVPITKIVCFGLGSLAPLIDDDSDTDESLSLSMSMSMLLDNDTGISLSDASPINYTFDWNLTRAHVQHAAVETIRTALQNRGMADASGVECYAQDPSYDAVDREFLATIGITALDDPKGFLELDANTLVLSVSPNVPIKQVVADVQWPAAMVWNTVLSVKDEPEEWVKRIMGNGEAQWASPFTTDPDSQRVRTMVEQYATATLDDANGFFGDITVYMR